MEPLGWMAQGLLLVCRCMEKTGLASQGGEAAKLIWWGRFANHPHIVGVLTVLFPMRRVVNYVLPDAVQFLAVADDPFVVVALPYRDSQRTPDFVDAFRGNGLEGPHQPP